ncbi:MAG: hypothetical protein AAFY99_12840 [Pseudomonadota bacterium]
MGASQFGLLLKIALVTTFLAGGIHPSVAGGAKLTFTATIAKVENGIGMAGDQTVTSTVLDVAAVSFMLTNPGNQAQRVTLAPFDAHFNAVSDINLASSIILPAGSSTTVYAYVPVAAGEKRRFRICANGNQGARCGKFIAQQLR